MSRKHELKTCFLIEDPQKALLPYIINCRLPPVGQTQITLNLRCNFIYKAHLKQHLPECCTLTQTPQMHALIQ